MARSYLGESILELFVSHLFPGYNYVYQRLQWNFINAVALLMTCRIFFPLSVSTFLVIDLLVTEPGVVVG